MSQEQKKKKLLWDLRQDVDGLRHPLPELSSRKTPLSSHTALEVPASAGLRGVQTQAPPPHAEPHGVGKLGHREESLATDC